MKNIINTVNVINVSTKHIIFVKQEYIKKNHHIYSPLATKAITKSALPLSTRTLTIYSSLLLCIAKGNHHLN